MRRALLPLILFVGSVCFALGVTQPLLRVERLYFLTDEPTLIDVVRELWGGGDWALAAIIALFSLAFPALKLGLLHIAAYAGPDGHAALPRWVKALSNWSMLDVVLVALVVFAAKTSGLAAAFTKPGLWFFAFSAILTATASALIKRKTAEGA